MKTGKDLFIDGGEIYLRLPNRSDIKGNWYKWLNDSEVTKYQNKGIFANSREKQRQYLRQALESRNDVIFAIIHKKMETHIGSIGLHKIDWVHRSAEIGIVIGEKKFWGKGYGRIAWNLMVDYGLNVLNLHRIYAVIFEDNIPSIKAAKSSGFKYEGKMRDMFYKKGEYHSALMFSVLEKEFNK